MGICIMGIDHSENKTMARILRIFLRNDPPPVDDPSGGGPENTKWGSFWGGIGYLYKASLVVTTARE